MKEKECKIVQDLLPNYIEKLTNEETNQFIEEHIEQCEECKEKLKKMEEEINVNNSKSEMKKVQYIKKYSNKMKLLKIILNVIVIVYLLFVARNAIIIMNLSIKAHSIMNEDNYYVKEIAYYGSSLNTLEYYKKGNDHLAIREIKTKDIPNVKLIHYKKGDEIIEIVDAEGKKHQNIIRDSNKNAMDKYIFPITNIKENFKLVFIMGIETRKCNGKDCYLIKTNDVQRYYDKKTGILVRVIGDDIKNNSFGYSTVGDWEYKFNVVQDSDIQRPNTSDAPFLQGID